MSEATPQAAPDVAIRSSPPTPKRLSGKVLLAGALCAGGIIAFALVAGLSDRPDRASSPHASAASASPPETIAGAADQYGAEQLGPPMLLNAEEQEDVAASLEPPQSGFASQAGGSDAAPPEPLPPAPILFSLTRTEGAAHNSVRLAPPISRFEIKAGDTINAVLLTALNSDLPGRVVAQVSAPVFDSVTGRSLLIPQGSRLLGTYQSNARYGDNRILFVWDRLILPNGWSLNLGAMNATDAQGSAGVADRTDNHLDRLGVAIALSALMSVVANEAEDNEDDDRLGPSVADAAAQQAAQTGGRIVERDLAVRPTLRVRAGANVRVLVTNDLVLQPYHAEVR